MDSDYTRGASISGCDFGFAFNDSKFSGPSDCAPDGEGCTSFTDWASRRKRRLEDIKKENDYSMCVVWPFSLTPWLVSSLDAHAASDKAQSTFVTY
ncbi:BTB/POZ domain-containing protein POB1-like [Hibiscus syriacus]|uniref:BTB/POZ domain-containing protein POB1-like n=1 Tax=Hibiscus syriacus TaxID=106335 RepID=UPI0019229D42|nr:BTB/POZ domain-containing protein POB1-like [Hibiscus syriacus]